MNSTVLRLGLVSLFADISSEMLYPITPIFLTTVLGASMFSVGLIEGFAEALASLLKTYSGRWSDRIQRRLPFIWVGYALACVAKPLMGFATTWTHILVARGIDRTGKGLRSSPRDALIADSVEKNHIGAAFGWHRFMDTLGAAIGPLLAFAFLTFDAQNIRSLYFWAVIPGLISILIVFSVGEKKPAIKYSKAQSPWAMREWSKGFKLYLLAWTLFSITNSSDVFLLLKVKQSGVETKTMILLYCFYNLIYAASSPYLGRLSDRVGRRAILTGGLLIFAAVYIGFSLATHTYQFWLLFGVYGLYMAATDGVGKALAVDLVPTHVRATGLGIVGTVTGISTIVASASAGLMWDNIGSSVPFVYGAAGAILAAVMLKFIKNKELNV